MTLYTLYTPKSNVAVHNQSNTKSLLYMYVCVGLLTLSWLELIVVMDKQSIEHI